MNSTDNLSGFASDKNAEIPSKYVEPFLIWQPTISGIAIFLDNRQDWLLDSS